MIPRNWAVTYGSSTTVSRRLGGLVAPSSRVARSAASVAARAEIELGGMATDAEPESGLGLAAVVGERADGDVAPVLTTGLADAGRGRHRDLTPRVGVVGVVDPHPRVPGQGQALELLGQIDLRGRRIRLELVAPQRLLGRGATSSGSARPAHSSTVPNVTLSRASATTSSIALGVERAGVGEPGPPVADDPHPDAFALGRDEVLDLALIHPHLGVAAARHVGLDLLAGSSRGDHLVGERLQRVELAHAAVPPTVIAATRRVG